ncbi:MAG: helix-turn-helix domain-containing protein [Bacteroidia bacterium]
MQINFNLLIALIAIVISQSFFAAGLLFASNKNKQSNRLLSILIIAIALWLTDDFLRISGIYRQFPNLYFLPLFYSLGFGPLIYFYVKSMVNRTFRFKANHLFHFIPVLLQSTLYVFLTFCDYSTKHWYWENIHQPYVYRIEFDGTWISMIVYLTISFKNLQEYQAWILNNFSETSKIKLNWLKMMIGALIVLCIQWLVEIILRDFFNLYFEYNYSIQILGIIALLLGIAGIRQANLSNVSFEKEEKLSTHFVLEANVIEKITEAMTSLQLYLDPTLTLVQFSGALKIPPKVVSKHINSGFEKSFNDFVNGYRVEEVKKRLKSADLQRLTIMGIALESGFNSKSTFNRIFKELTGMAPTDYIK